MENKVAYKYSLMVNYSCIRAYALCSYIIENSDLSDDIKQQLITICFKLNADALDGLWTSGNKFEPLITDEELKIHLPVYQVVSSSLVCILTPELYFYLQNLAINRKISAMRVLREKIPSLSLKTAKNIIEFMQQSSVSIEELEKMKEGVIVPIDRI